jgi:hypothetical protein
MYEVDRPEAGTGKPCGFLAQPPIENGMKKRLSQWRYAPALSGLSIPIPVFFRNRIIIYDPVKHCNSFFSFSLYFQQLISL